MALAHPIAPTGGDETGDVGGAVPQIAAARRSPLAVLLALLLAAETVAAVILAAGKVWMDLQTNRGMPGAPTDYVLWLALASDAVFFAAAVVLGVATTAVWQYGWGRGRLVGPRKRAAVWAALFVQLTAVVPVPYALFPASVRPEEGDSNSLGMLVFMLVLGGGLVWVLRRDVFRGAGRHVVAWTAGSVVVGLVVASVSVGYAVRVSEQSFADWSASMLADQPFSQVVVCRHDMSAACARRAADRAQQPFAWAPTPPDRDLVVVASRSQTTGHFFASEQTYDRSHLTIVFVDSGSSAGQPTGSLVRTVGRGTSSAHVFAWSDTTTAEAQVVWTHDGATYDLTATRFVRGSFSDAEIDSLIALWRQVRYAEPAHTATGARSGSSATGGA